MQTLRAFAIAASAALLAPALLAQSTAGAQENPRLSVTRCDAAANTCGSGAPDGAEARNVPMPVLGPTGRATVLSPSRRTTEAALDTAEYRLLIPGCVPEAAGVFVCESVLEYEHCRTLMVGRMIPGCRIEIAFRSGFAEARPARPGEYEMAVKSNAKVRVTRGVRGFGEIRGDADVSLRMAAPTELPGAWCLERARYLYHSTGPKGGVSAIDDAAPCDEPIEFSFEPHADDLLRAYDLCESFAVWGDELADSIEILAAGLYHFRSASPEFMADHPAGSAIVAPYVSVKAPLTIDCRV